MDIVCNGHCVGEEGETSDVDMRVVAPRDDWRFGVAHPVVVFVEEPSVWQAGALRAVHEACPHVGPMRGEPCRSIAPTESTNTHSSPGQVLQHVICNLQF